MKICIYGASSNAIDKTFLDHGEELGRVIANMDHTVVFGGGAAGLMGAVARGAHEQNGKIIGICPSFFNVDGALFENCTEMIYTETMRERKQLLEDMSDAFIITPGGIGTFDEFFETYTLHQLGILKKPIAILNTNGYYNPLLEMLNNAVEENFMPKVNLDLFYVSSDVKKIIEYFENYKPNETIIENFKFINKEKT